MGQGQAAVPPSLPHLSVFLGRNLGLGPPLNHLGSIVLDGFYSGRLKIQSLLVSKELGGQCN